MGGKKECAEEMGEKASVLQCGERYLFLHLIITSYREYP